MTLKHSSIMLQPEGQVKESQAAGHSPLTELLPTRAESYLRKGKVRNLILCVSAFLSSSLHLLLVLFFFLYLVSLSNPCALCPSIIHLLFIFTGLPVLLSVKEQNCKSKRRGAQSKHSHTYSRSIQTTSLPAKKRCDSAAQTWT